MLVIKRGDVFFSELIGVGSMQVGIRPVIVISNDKCNKYSKTITVVPCSLSETKAKLPTHVKMDNESSTHKLHGGMALAECITTIDKSLLRRKVGKLSSKEMFKVSIAVLIQVGVDVFEIIKDCAVDMFRCIKGGV